jgi:hypothetical protein
MAYNETPNKEIAMLKTIVKNAAIISLPVVVPAAVIGAWILVGEVQAWAVLKKNQKQETAK